MKRFYVIEIYGMLFGGAGEEGSIWNPLLEAERTALPTKPNRHRKDAKDIRPEGDWTLGYQAYEMLPGRPLFWSDGDPDPLFDDLGIFRPTLAQMPIIFCVPDEGHGQMEFKKQVTVDDAVAFIRERI